MRSRLTESGARVLTAKIEVPLDQDAIATYATSHWQWEDNPEAYNEIMSLNKRELFRLAKEVIRRYGYGSEAYARASSNCYSNWSQNHLVRVRQHVADMFPEID